MLLFAVFLALIWGVLWALFLQLTRTGHYLAVRRTWLSVVVGVGVDLLIALLVVPFEVWLVVVAIVTASSVGIIGRSLYNEWADEKAIEDVRNGCS